MPLSPRLPRVADLRALLVLALPAVIVQLGMMAMGVADVVMVGHVSAAALAAVALGNLYFFGAAMFGMGTLMALDPVVAQAVGAGDGEAVARAVQRGLLLAALLCVPTAIVLWPAPTVLRLLHQPLEVVPIAAAYSRISILGTVGFFGFMVLRQSLQALGRMRPIVITIVLANLLNILLNWVLIFGHLGFPAMGAVGSAWATAASRLIMALLLAVLAWPLLREQFQPLRRGVFEPAPLRRLFMLGAPIGIQHQLEYGVFGVVGLLMGVMGTNQMAGHQVALNLASVTFMVPLGVSGAAAVLVGHSVGRQDAAGAHRAAHASLTVAVAFMGATALVFLLLPGPLARIYSDTPEVIAVAATLIPLAGVFQVFDGIQVTSIGILRGLGDTRAPMITAVLGFWILGLPVSLWLAFGLGLGPAGLWWGLVIGLVAVAGFLYIRARRRLRQPLRRVRIDDPAPGDLPAPLAG